MQRYETNKNATKNIFARAQLVETGYKTEYAIAKIGKYSSDIPQFSKDPASCKKQLNVNIHNNIHLTLQ